MNISNNKELENAINNNEKSINIISDIRVNRPIVINSKSDIVINGNGYSLVGANLVTQKWTELKNNIYMTKLEPDLDIQAVFKDNKPCIMARYPNYREAEPLNGCCDIKEIEQRLAKYKNVSGGYLRAIHDREWGGNSYIISGINNGKLLLDWIGDNNRGSKFLHSQVMVENLFEELDSPSEWFYYKQTGELYIMLDEDDDINKVKIEYSIVSDIFLIQNSNKITITNLVVTKTNRTMFNSKYRFVTRSDWGVAERGVIKCTNSFDITITNCTFVNTYGNCVYIGGKNKEIKVIGCNFLDIGASGVLIYGNESACRNLSTWSKHYTRILDKAVGPLNDNYPTNCVVKNCYFKNTGIFEKQSAPISISVASDCFIQGNTICKTPRAGINICDGCFGGHIIENNDIFDTVRESGDHGPFNSWGRDRFWSLYGFNTTGKYGKAKRKYALLDAYKTNIIKHNRFVGNRLFGIDLDDGSSNYEITHNICYNVGIKLREGFDRKVYNNIIINAPLDLHCTYSRNCDVINNNVIVSNNPIRTYSINRGFNTKIEKNIFVGADNEVFASKIFNKSNINSNILTEYSLDEVLKMDYKDIDFESFNMEFGRSDADKPDINNISVVKQAKPVYYKKSIISDIDDGIRTIAGLGDNKGVFVIKAKNALKKIGLKNGDVIVRINKNDIKDIVDCLNIIDSTTSIEVMRNQQILVLNREKKESKFFFRKEIKM